jgi:hypothetical protein
VVDNWIAIRRTAQKEETPRALLEEVGDVLSDHQRFEGDHTLAADHLASGVSDHRRYLRVVHHGWGARFVFEESVAMHGARNSCAQLGNARQEMLAQVGIEGPERPTQHDVVRDDVVGVSAVNAPDRDHRGRNRRYLTADQGLQGHDDVTCDDDRIRREMGLGAVAALPLDGHGKPVGARHDRAGADRYLSDWQPGPDMQSHDPVDALKDTGLDHRFRTAGNLLGRLKSESNQPRHLLLSGGQQFGERQGNRHMHIVATGVHHPLVRRLKRKLGALSQRKGIHVGPHQHTASGSAAPQRSHHAGFGQPRRDFETPPLQMLGDNAGGLDLLESELRLGMKSTTPRQQVLLASFNLGVEFGQHLADSGTRGRLQLYSSFVPPNGHVRVSSRRDNVTFAGIRPRGSNDQDRYMGKLRDLMGHASKEEASDL